MGIYRPGASIIDPCTWLNNATNGRNGQFSEHIDIKGTPGAV